MRKPRHTVRVKVWDPAIRVFHWLLVALVLALWASGEFGKLAVHMVLGPTALALLLARVVWGFVGSPTALFSHFVKGPRAALAYIQAARHGHPRSVGHNPLGAYSVLMLLGLLLVQALTGLITSDDIVTEGPLAHLVSAKTVALASTVHRVGFKVLLGFIALHLAAVAFYRFAKKDDLIRAMITGLKEVPEGAHGIHYRNPLLALAILAVCLAAVWGVIEAFPAPAF